MGKRIGFTLAEVLITLGIIGVVAAITIPTLNNQIQNMQLKTALKKTYSSLSQAHAMIVNDNGGTFKGLCSTDACITTLFKEKMKVIKDCPIASSLGNCFAAHQSWLGADQSGEAASDIESFVIADGASIGVWGAPTVSVDCSDTRVVINSLNASCAVIQVDVNGLKPPNKQGEDIYYIHVLADRLLPFGGVYSDPAYQNCDKSISSHLAGNGCAFVVLNGGWHN